MRLNLHNISLFFLIVCRSIIVCVRTRKICNLMCRREKLILPDCGHGWGRKKHEKSIGKFEFGARFMRQLADISQAVAAWFLIPRQRSVLWRNKNVWKKLYPRKKLDNKTPWAIQRFKHLWNNKHFDGTNTSSTPYLQHKLREGKKSLK